MSKGSTRMNRKVKSFLKNNIGLFSFIVLMVCFRSAVADWYTIPSASMKPTLEVGDRIVVDKMAYDLRIPLTNISLKKMGEPKRGDIVVFESVAADNRLIKRVIGLPGDKVSMTNEVLTINGTEVNYHVADINGDYNYLVENLSGLKHIVKHDKNKLPHLANFNTVVVPHNHYLVLGDNRRNSSDSRVYGFVPHEELKGKANYVAFSLNYDNYYLPKQHRFAQDLYAL
jgi:signal peptidase I